MRGAPCVLGGGGIVGGVNLDCVLTSAGESGMVECFPVRSAWKRNKKAFFRILTPKHDRHSTSV